MTDFCETLRERRKSVGLSQKKLSARTGINVNTIRNIETGKTIKPFKYTMETINAAIEAVRKEKLRVLTENEK